MSISINFLLGCHSGQLFDPLSEFSSAHKSVEVDFAIGLCLVYRSAGEPTRLLVRGSDEQSAAASEFEVGGETSVEDFPRRASRRAPLAAVAES